MEVQATHRYMAVSPRKIRLVLEHLPGKSVGDAINMLKFFPSTHARMVARVVKSAASNAENNYSMDPDALFVKRATANEGRRMKRFRPASRGRVHNYQHRSSHVTIVVDEREGS